MAKRLVEHTSSVWLAWMYVYIWHYFKVFRYLFKNYTVSKNVQTVMDKID